MAKDMADLEKALRAMDDAAPAPATAVGEQNALIPADLRVHPWRSLDFDDRDANLLAQDDKDYILVPYNQKSFIAYVAEGGSYKGSSATLQYRTRFLQKQEQCAFYVCHHMQQIMSAKLKDPQGLDIDLDSLVMREISEVRGKLYGFIKTQIINADREFHSVDTAEQPSNN